MQLSFGWEVGGNWRWWSWVVSQTIEVCGRQQGAVFEDHTMTVFPSAAHLQIGSSIKFGVSCIQLELGFILCCWFSENTECSPYLPLPRILSISTLRLSAWSWHVCMHHQCVVLRDHHLQSPLCLQPPPSNLKPHCTCCGVWTGCIERWCDYLLWRNWRLRNYIVNSYPVKQKIRHMQHHGNVYRLMA